MCREQCIQLDHQAYIKEAMQQEDVEKVLNELTHSFTESNGRRDCGDEEASGQAHVPSYPRLTFLGTGSSVPSKGRNVSGLVVHLR